MARYWPLAIGAGLMSAVMYGLLTTGSAAAFVLAYFIQLPIFLAGLGLGVVAGAVAGAVGLSALMVADGVFAAAFYLAVILPALVMIQKALLGRETEAGAVEWYPPGRLAIWLAGLALAALVAAMLALTGAPGGLEGAVQAFVRANLADMLSRVPEQSGARVETVAKILPGIVLCSWMLMTIINGGLAQGLLSRFGHNIRPSLDIAELELPRWAPITLAVALALAVFGNGWLGFFGVTALAVVAVPFFLAGLAVIHAMARPHKSRQAILGLCYVILVIFAWPAIMVAALGLIEQWAQLRRHFLAQV
ncbi:MAG: DUF2232 domain-containing protein [Kiloniellales bacterium]